MRRERRDARSPLNLSRLTPCPLANLLSSFVMLPQKQVVERCNGALFEFRMAGVIAGQDRDAQLLLVQLDQLRVS